MWVTTSTTIHRGNLNNFEDKGDKFQKPFQRETLEICVARITTDAYLTDWGAPNGLHTCQGKWSTLERRMNINLLELRVIRKAMKCLVPS